MRSRGIDCEAMAHCATRYATLTGRDFTGIIAMPRIAVLAALLLAGCAPDAMNNRAATGLDGFVNQVQRACAPLQLGRYQLADPLMGGAGNNSYDYWLDQTSRLYYHKISAAKYRESLNAFFGAG